MRHVRSFFVVCAMLLFASPVLAASRPALFSEEAGFHQARFARESIRVAGGDWVWKGMKYWNNRAQWELFVYADDPQVTTRFDRTCTACAWAYPQWTAPYERCEISLDRKSRQEVATVAHELGHCLGLRHQGDGVMRSTGPGSIQRGWKAFDRRLLLEAGYTE